MTDTDATIDALLTELGSSWPTVDQITAARERLIARLPGWHLPAAYGIATVAPDGAISFVRANVGEHPLPAVVMSTVLGHGGESAAYLLDATSLDQAIRLLAPAEACTAYEHPNLAAWREVRQAVAAGETAVAVFLRDLDYTGEDPAVLELQAVAAAR
ncbi:hypothetical protein [Glycomyces terrestris]|uniref:Uncharacterized protein n=1 Tax=Glycomyces terrestris TaxID=2493553 RepID=A0A426V3K6_9ACTN|nr:hypothetical protein [Glycomyces terrestris]RRS01489.1 hypothetical protein EIW28_01585 [Glycomyces terrestris]